MREIDVDKVQPFVYVANGNKLLNEIVKGTTSESFVLTNVLPFNDRKSFFAGDTLTEHSKSDKGKLSIVSECYVIKWFAFPVSKMKAIEAPTRAKEGDLPSPDVLRANKVIFLCAKARLGQKQERIRTAACTQRAHTLHNANTQSAGVSGCSGC